MFDYKKFSRELEQTNQDIEKTRIEWQKTKAQMDFLVRHRYKIWTIYLVCIALIILGLLN